MSRRANHAHSLLLVEDSDDERESLAMLLELAGYRVVGARRALPALHLMLTLGLRPCTVVADIIMPGMDGVTLRAEMKKYPKLACIPTVALTGHEGLRRHAVDNGFAAGLLKPCEFDELFRLIDQLCCSRAALHAAKRM